MYYLYFLLAPEIVNIDLKIENIIQVMFYTGENCAMIIKYDDIALASILRAFKIKENDDFYDQHFKSIKRYYFSLSIIFIILIIVGLDVSRNVMTSFFLIEKNEKTKFKSLLSILPEQKVTVISLDRVIKVLELYNMDEKEVCF
jgi:hypothetical protein